MFGYPDMSRNVDMSFYLLMVTGMDQIVFLEFFVKGRSGYA